MAKVLSDFLIEAKKVIEDSEKWTQGWFAKDIEGNCVSAIWYGAKCFCSLGAIERVAGIELGDAPDCSLSDCAHAALSEAMGGSVDEFNDSHTHEEVMEKWDQAIKDALKEESEE